MVIKIPKYPLTLADLKSVAFDKVRVELKKNAISKILRAKEEINQILLKNMPIYGVNTGFGALANRLIPKNKLKELQENLIMSHATGTGDFLPNEVVRAAIFLRANMLSKGYSGVRPELIAFLTKLLNYEIVPLVREKGSVGASGDLAPLAFIGLLLIGKGEAIYQGKRLKGIEVLRRVGLKPLSLEPKEGLALINGTEVMTGFAGLNLLRAQNLCEISDLTGGLSFLSLKGDKRVFSQQLHALKPHKEQILVAQSLRKLLRGTAIDNPHIPQDAYSLRCIPQIHSAARAAVTFGIKVVETEMNSITDNPVILNRQVLSGGNFHGSMIALAMDCLAIGLGQIAGIAERRIFRLLDDKLSGLPPFLTKNPGINSGLMMAQVLAATLLTENKILSNPASIHSVPTSANQEDWTSMGMNAGLKLKTILENTETILAIEAIVACQAIEILGIKYLGSSPLKDFFYKIRSFVPFLTRDREISDDIQKIKTWIREYKK